MRRRTAFGRDVGLMARMALTMTLLAALYLAFGLVLLRFGASVLVIVTFSGVLLLLQYFFSDQMVLMATGAREVGPDALPDVHRALSRLSALADLPMPRVALMDTDVPNAFATGRSPKSALVAVTTGLIRRLSPPELEAVLAHELSHVKNRDMVVITLASFFSTLAAMIVQMGMYWGLGFGERRRNGEGENLLLVYVVSLLVYLLSYLLLQALSRYREFAADRGSAILTGAPSQLASALMKISGAMDRIPNRDLRQVEGMNAFFIIPALSSDSLLELLSTHPSLERRLAYLRRLEEELER